MSDSMVNPRNKPEFLRALKESIKRLKGKWRKPRGKQSKMRLHKKGKRKVVRIGWGAPRHLRYKHPSGYYEILVENLKQLEGIDPETQAIRISARVGRKKRQMILEKAKELGIKVLNP